MITALIDGSNLIQKIFHAVTDRKTKEPLYDPMPVLSIQCDAMRASFASVRVALDARGPNWRTDLCSEYKSARDTKSVSLHKWIGEAEEFLQAEFACVRVPGFEADDVIATWSIEFSAANRCVIVSADKDLHQCLRYGSVTQLRSFRSYRRELVDCQWITSDAFTEKYGLVPPQWPHYRAIVGDKSDSMNGVQGVGPVTAENLLRKYPTLEDFVDAHRRFETTGVPDAAARKILADWEAGNLQKWIRIHTLSKSVPMPAVTV